MNNEKKVWLHRCYFAPLFLNFNCKNSGKPALLNYEQYGALGDIDSGYILGLPEGFLVDDDITSEYEEYMQFLYSLGISKEECLEAIKSNYQQQANKFFENGLYTIYTSLDRTATQYSDEQISRILQLPNFGFNDFRGDLNVALILEIPPKCFEFMGQQQLYENSDKPLEVYTQYHGIQKTSKVVPTQYIKRIVVSYGKTTLTIDNPNFDLEYIPKNNGNGRELFDGSTFQNLKYFIGNPANEDNIISYVLEIKEKATDKEYEIFLRQLLNLCENRANLQSQVSFISEELDRFRTPYEKSYVALEKCNPEDISLDKLENIILEFLQNSNINLKETLSVDDWYKKGNSLIQELLPYLSTSPKFNDIAGEIGNRDNIITISEYIFRYSNIIIMYEECGKNILSLYGVSEEQIPQIRLQYEAMSESFKEIATNSDQNIVERVNAFLKMYSNGAISLNTSSDVNKEQPLHNDNDARTSEFSGRDIVEASYDADTELCDEAYKIVQEIQRSDMENGHSQ